MESLVISASHNLISPVLHTINASDIEHASKNLPDIWEAVGKLTIAWASLESALTGLLINESGTLPHTGYIMIGRMSSKAKFDKIIKIMKANKFPKEAIDSVIKWKKDTAIPCEIRNIISHCTLLGEDKNDANLLYFGGTRAPEEADTIICHKLYLREILWVANFAQKLALIIYELALKQLQSRLE